MQLLLKQVLHHSIIVGLSLWAAGCNGETSEDDSDSGTSSGGAGSEQVAGGGQDAGGDVNDQANTGTCMAPKAASLTLARVPSGYCAWTFAESLSEPRGVIVDGAGDTLVVERGEDRIVALWDEDGDAVSSVSERTTIAEANGLNHGITIHDGYLYASSDTTVYRWAYSDGSRTNLGDPEVVVSGLPGGGHSTRTLIAKDDWLYVSIGSFGNVDADSSRSRIVRYSISEISDAPANGQGELFADGLRNEVGLDFDDQGRLWGVENGLDNLTRQDLGGDIHQDNPAEEVNLFETPGAFYGYPYCWTEFKLATGAGKGTQWVHPNFMDVAPYDDDWCRNPDNVVKPQASMQAHSAPLDITFYHGAGLPAEVVGDAFVSFHGSWNRDPATGYKLVRLPFGSNGLPTGEVVSMLEHAGSGDTAADWPHRPVGIAITDPGYLVITSDASGTVLALGHQNP